MRQTNPKPVFRKALAVSLTSALVVACAPTGPPVDRDVEKMESFKHEDFQKKKWQESGFELPPYPEEANLMEAKITGPATFTFLVDSQSISIGDDDVVRYTLVSRSSSGADNVSYEGIQCEKNEYKVYAFGSVDRSWTLARNPEWKPIKAPGINKYHHDLHDFYFCDWRIMVPFSVEQVTAALKRGIPYPPSR